MADEEYEAEDAGADYDDIAEDDNDIEETEEQEEEGYNVQCLAPGQAGGGVEKSKRITTRYMTKYERARVLGKVMFSAYTLNVFYRPFFVFDILPMLIACLKEFRQAFIKRKQLVNFLWLNIQYIVP